MNIYTHTYIYKITLTVPNLCAFCSSEEHKRIIYYYTHKNFKQL